MRKGDDTGVMDRGGSGWEAKGNWEEEIYFQGRERVVYGLGDREVIGDREKAHGRFTWVEGEGEGRDTSTVSTTKLSLVKLPADNIFHAFRDLFRLSIYWSYWELRSRVTFWGGVDVERKGRRIAIYVWGR